ncbi:hypothetical protein MGG_17575 [Pyricularia oryzae 70-15]|uniref:Uncharacterized protein n=3 Tax=Pyricularia oryzae TaxID=318829 RepID=G4NFQ5_PYRO7|nr:uncharacterized protein MGG_17575 [Pyricularia oryzae 70-15]EHA46862.1 hypothetical protein MGG_17575 [Pyricularia oryzae 70-15]ELQ32653.1 hypothetical protein OOU_Y34scaffold01075g9 [Pyricularia oryzae Y34]
MEGNDGSRRKFFEVVYQWLVYYYTQGSENALGCIVTEMRSHSGGALAVKVSPSIKKKRLGKN